MIFFLFIQYLWRTRRQETAEGREGGLLLLLKFSIGRKLEIISREEVRSSAAWIEPQGNIARYIGKKNDFKKYVNLSHSQEWEN